MYMDPALLLLVIVIFAMIMLVQGIVPIILSLACIGIAIAVVNLMFKDNPKAQRIVSGILIFLIGAIICASSMETYRALFTGNIVIGGPRPGGILLCFAGIAVLIWGLIGGHEK